MPQGDDILDLGESSSALPLLLCFCDELVAARADEEAPAEEGRPCAACRLSSAISVSFSAMT